MITYEVKLKKIGEMTTIPDSQRLFGFLINSSKKCCTEDDISTFVKGVKEKKEKCMISNLMPTGYYPTPKAFILQNLECKLAENQEKIKEYEKEQNELNIESNSIVRELISKNNMKKNESIELNKEEKKKLNDEINNLKLELDKIKNNYNSLSKHINNLSGKNIYDAIKNMDFIKRFQLNDFLKLSESKEIINVKKVKNFNYIKKNQTFIQKFRLENQIKELPGLPNIAYSLPILSFVDKKNKVVKEFSFFVKVMEGTCISNILQYMKNSISEQKTIGNKYEIPCFLGGKGSSGYNEYSIHNIEIISEEDEEIPSTNANYLNIGVLLPNFDKIDENNSVLDIYTSDRKPFEIENEISKVISFVTAGSVIKVKEYKTELYKVGKSIDNSKYNPLYKKNAIIFGNSYLIKLEV
ncbi:hypothetical protein [Parvimonas sp. G1967]|uniref:hypothetical protein n=1 Tax=Parvimonas sp. G1967 TaxID=3387695 RepID=UPI0039E5A438